MYNIKRFRNLNYKFDIETSFFILRYSSSSQKNMNNILRTYLAMPEYEKVAHLFPFHSSYSKVVIFTFSSVFTFDESLQHTAQPRQQITFQWLYNIQQYSGKYNEFSSIFSPHKKGHKGSSAQKSGY